MAVQNQRNLYEQYENDTIAVSPFAQSHMGLLTGQTAMKIETYMIACVPFRLSMKGAMLLGAFSREELVFFQRYAGSLAGLSLVFQPGNSPQPLKIFARCVLKSVAPMQGKESIGIITVEWKPCPPDLLGIIGDYFLLLDRLKAEYQDFKAHRISINAASAHTMGYNNYAVLQYGGGQHKAALFALASDRLEFLLPMNTPPLEQGGKLSVKLYFRVAQFSVAAQVAELTRLPNGAQKATLAIGFSPELVDIIERYRFAERFSAAKGPDQTEPGA